MIEVLSAANDGQFTIGKTSSEEIHSVSSNHENSSDNSEKGSIEVTSTKVEMPNLLDLLSGWL